MLVTEWIALDDGSHVRIDEHDQVVADVFMDDEGWAWVVNIEDNFCWALECSSPEEGKALCDQALAEAGYRLFPSVRYDA